MGNLRRELAAEPDASIRAAILYHMGGLYEHELGRPADARECYEQAQEAASELQPPAIARMRMAERSAGSDEVAALCAERIASTQEPSGRATALLDMALRSDDWASFLREAMARSPEPAVPGLVFEWLAEGRQAPDALREALRAQAEHAADPALQGALFVDVALAEVDAGEIDAALHSLELACASDQVAWAARSLQRRVAREHERWDALVSASVSMARLLESDAPVDPLSLSVPEEERLPMAAFLWKEAATVSTTKLDDLDGAAAYLSSALRLLPEDRALRLQALLLGERRGAGPDSAETNAWFQETAPDDPAFVTHEIRRALANGAQESSLAVLREAAARYPSSEYAQAALDVALVRAESRAERIERLLARAIGVEGEARALPLWHAARLLSASARPSEDAQAAFLEAASASSQWEAAILRDALGAAVHERDAEAIIARCDELQARGVSDEEHSVLSFCKYDVARHLARAPDVADRFLREALADGRCSGWAPDVARARAAHADDCELLALAHEALAERSDGDDVVGHLCAAGRAYARNRDWGRAERVLRDALSRAPDESYVVGLLEGVLRQGGRPEDVVALARARRSEANDAALGELSMLLAGATAERDGNLAAARHAYEQALHQSPDSASAALALADVERRAGDEGAKLRAYESLVRSDLGGGVRELFSLLGGDSRGFENGGSPDASAAYELALEHPVTALPAAVALLSTPRASTTDDQRAAAEETLADTIVPSGAAANGFAAAYGGLRGALDEHGASADDAWVQLAALAPNEDLRADALLHGLREMRIARGEQAGDELFMLAHESVALANDHPKAAIALDEALAPGDDPELRAEALQHKLRHGTTLGRSALDAALCRALVEAERGDDAVARLSNALDERPDDLALWETLRTAARQAGQWPLVAQSCERLAVFVEGTLRADLLEEAGAVRLDCLQQDQQAEDLFRAALEADPTRSVAFRRLHDLLAEREDADGLEQLVSARLALGGPKDRPDLLYERARLLRGFSDRPGALEVLDELFTTEPEHSGALALAAEVHVSLEQWSEAVGCLRRLSQSNIPDEQRRVAHLGAADFLEAHLGEKDQALAELRAVEALGLADASTWLRIGGLEEQLGNAAAAVDAYGRALQTAPTDETAVARLSELTEGDARQSMLRSYEEAVWERIDRGELDASLLQGLRKAAHARGDLERAAAVAAAESALHPQEAHASGATDLGHVSVASLWDREADTVVEEVLRRAGPELRKERVRAKKLGPNAGVYAELEQITERFGARLGSVSAASNHVGIDARPGRDGELHWVVSKNAVNGLDVRERFSAGRLAWSAPHGASALVDDSLERAAGTIAAILRTARCRVTDAEPVLPAVAVRLRRATRKSVYEAAGNTEVAPTALVEAARRLHRSADRAGLLACGDISAAFSALERDQPSIESIRDSARCLDLLRFWTDGDSPLWRDDA
jgi:hypothetical protein